MLSRHPPGRPMYGKKEMFKATLSRSRKWVTRFCRDGVGSSEFMTQSNCDPIGFMEDRKGTLWSYVSGTDLSGMAGAPGFEPGNVGTKNRCLTTWRRPNCRQSRLCGALLAEQPKSTMPMKGGENACLGEQKQRRQMARVGYSDHTAISLPAGSAKWKRRPPGNAKIGLTTVPPAFSTASRVASRSLL